jgi:hypothetical protein
MQKGKDLDPKRERASALLKKYFKIRGVIALRQTPWTCDRIN